MKSHFPDRVDAFPLTLTLTERNAIESGSEFTLVDAMYMIRALQAYCIELAALLSPVDTTSSTDTAGAAAVASLSAQVSLLPAYLSGAGVPAAGLGKNGDSYWDTVGLMGYQKLGGVWRQVA